MTVFSQTRLLLARLVRQQVRSPLTYFNLVLSLFFLAVYTGAFGDAGPIERLTGASFLTFILPVTILSAAVAGSAAGQLLVADLEAGYLKRLLTLPVSRFALVLAPMLVGALLVTAQAVLLLGLGIALGVEVAAERAGAVAVVGFALLWGLAFAGYSVATGLITGNAAAAQAASFVFFPLIFMGPTFLPRDALEGWLQTAAAANPTTYVLEAMRSLLIDGWEAGPVLAGAAVIGGLCVASLWWAARVATRVTARA